MVRRSGTRAWAMVLGGAVAGARPSLIARVQWQRQHFCACCSAMISRPPLDRAHLLPRWRQPHCCNLTWAAEGPGGGAAAGAAMMGAAGAKEAAAAARPLSSAELFSP